MVRICEDTRWLVALDSGRYTRPAQSCAESLQCGAESQALTWNTWRWCQCLRSGVCSSNYLFVGNELFHVVFHCLVAFCGLPRANSYISMNLAESVIAFFQIANFRSLRIVQDISNVADMVNVTALWVQLELMLSTDSTIAGSHGELRSSMDSRSQCGQRHRGAYNAGDDGISWYIKSFRWQVVTGKFLFSKVFGIIYIRVCIYMYLYIYIYDRMYMDPPRGCLKGSNTTLWRMLVLPVTQPASEVAKSLKFCQCEEAAFTVCRLWMSL